MDTDVQGKREDQPLTREDVERFLHVAGSPDQLHVSGRNLKEVNLAGLDLHGADLSRADLRGVDLGGANLKDAAGGISVEELEKQAKSLKGATMPDGSKHP